MARINLLPWREAQRKKSQITFLLSLAGSLLSTVLIVTLVNIYISNLKDYQTRRNQLIQQQILVFDQKIQEIKDIEQKKAKLLTKINVIQGLQASRPEVVHLFTELAKVTPEGVYLTKFNQAAEKLSFDGKAESNARVSAFMQAIDSSLWLNSAGFGVIKGQGKTAGAMNDFSMIAKLGKKPESVSQPGAAQ